MNGSKYNVDPYLIFLVMEQESHFNTHAVSPKGARGLMQLMPGTAARFGVRRSHDPAQNISGGTRYLRELLNRFNNRVDLVLASYNAGEGAVAKFGNRVPPYQETRNYVKKISYRYKRTTVRTRKPKAMKTSYLVILFYVFRSLSIGATHSSLKVRSQMHRCDQTRQSRLQRENYHHDHQQPAEQLQTGYRRTDQAEAQRRE